MYVLYNIKKVVFVTQLNACEVSISCSLHIRVMVLVMLTPYGAHLSFSPSLSFCDPHLIWGRENIDHQFHRESVGKLKIWVSFSEVVRKQKDVQNLLMICFHACERFWSRSNRLFLARFLSSHCTKGKRTSVSVCACVRINICICVCVCVLECSNFSLFATISFSFLAWLQMVRTLTLATEKISH